MVIWFQDYQILRVRRGRGSDPDNSVVELWQQIGLTDFLIRLNISRDTIERSAKG